MQSEFHRSIFLPHEKCLLTLLPCIPYTHSEASFLPLSYPAKVHGPPASVHRFLYPSFLNSHNPLLYLPQRNQKLSFFLISAYCFAHNKFADASTCASAQFIISPATNFYHYKSKICTETVTVQPRTLHLLQSPYMHVNLAKKESAPRRRRFGIGRFRNRETEG